MNDCYSKEYSITHGFGGAAPRGVSPRLAREEIPRVRSYQNLFDCSLGTPLYLHRRSMNTRSFAIHMAERGKSINFDSSSTAISIARRPSGVFPRVARSARSNHASA